MYELNRQEFGRFLAQLRKEKGLTQKQVAQQLMISDKAVSKWETGVSIPDTALLVPLAELLEVTVTELLLHQRLEKPMAPETVEGVVQRAVAYGSATSQRAWQTVRRSWCFVLALLASGLLWYGNRLLGTADSTLSTMLVLSAGFGGYFWFWAPVRLPNYYDQNPISGFSDGPVRMNLMGLRFHNGNWPHICKCLRLWSLAMLVLYPLIPMVLGLWQPQLWAAAERWVVLAVLGATLFLPVYVTGRRHDKTA